MSAGLSLFSWSPDNAHPFRPNSSSPHNPAPRPAHRNQQRLLQLVSEAHYSRHLEYFLDLRESANVQFWLLLRKSVKILAQFTPFKLSLAVVGLLLLVCVGLLVLILVTSLRRDVKWGALEAHGAFDATLLSGFLMSFLTEIVYSNYLSQRQHLIQLELVRFSYARQVSHLRALATTWTNRLQARQSELNAMDQDDCSTRLRYLHLMESFFVSSSRMGHHHAGDGFDPADADDGGGRQNLWSTAMSKVRQRSNRILPPGDGTNAGSAAGIAGEETAPKQGLSISKLVDSLMSSRKEGRKVTRKDPRLAGGRRGSLAMMAPQPLAGEFGKEIKAKLGKLEVTTQQLRSDMVAALLHQQRQLDMDEGVKEAQVRGNEGGGCVSVRSLCLTETPWKIQPIDGGAWCRARPTNGPGLHRPGGQVA